MRKLRVLLVDDRPVRRFRVAAVLQKREDVEVVGQLSVFSESLRSSTNCTFDVLAVSTEIARCFSEYLIEAKSRQSTGTKFLTSEIMDVIRRLSSMPKTQIVQYDDETNIGNQIDEIKDRFASSIDTQRDETHRPKWRDRRTTILLPIIAIGASTGGIDALTSVLTKFPENCPPTLIVQHMPAAFIKGFTARMDGLCKPTICEAIDGDKLVSGKVYIAPGDGHLEIIRGGGGLVCRVFKGAARSGHVPSVDLLFESLAALRGPRIGVIMTGMGRDGAEGLLQIRQSGGNTFGQDEGSSVVYGMPRVAYEIGAVESQLPLMHLGDEIIRLSNRLTRIATNKR